MKRWVSAVVAGAALAAAGCLQLETTIKLNEDGSALVTERLSLSRRLLEMAKGDGQQPNMESLLTREAVEQRVKQMGKGVTLITHEVRDGGKGSRECLTTYKVADLTEFVYISPSVGWQGYRAQCLKFSITPNLSFVEWYRAGVPPGVLVVSARAEKYQGVAAGEKNAPMVPGGDSPRDVQAYRELVPVFADMLGDLRVRVTIESYCAIGNAIGVAFRDSSARVRHVDLINVSGKTNTDYYGYRFLRNEDIMTEALRSRMGTDARQPSYGRFWTTHLYGDDSRPDYSHMRANPTLPLILQGGRANIWIPPSAPLFKKYLEGKTLDWTGSLNPAIKARGKKLADFKEVGWTDTAARHKPAEEDRCPPDCPWCRGERKEDR